MVSSRSTERIGKSDSEAPGAVGPPELLSDIADVEPDRLTAPRRAALVLALVVALVAAATALMITLMFI